MGLWDFITNQSPPLVTKATRDLIFMLETAEGMFADATGCLLDNEPLTSDLSAQDQLINEREEAIRRSVLEHLSVEPEDDLVYSLVLVSVVQEAERIGDLAKTLSKTALLAHKPRLGPHVEPLRRLRDRINEMFQNARAGFRDGDKATAQRVVDMHAENKTLVADYIKTLADADDVSANESMVFAMTATFMSRVSSHLANILSSVVVPFDQLRRAQEDA